LFFACIYAIAALDFLLESLLFRYFYLCFSLIDLPWICPSFFAFSFVALDVSASTGFSLSMAGPFVSDPVMLARSFQILAYFRGIPTLSSR
jgi:hypothetical protein